MTRTYSFAVVRLAPVYVSGEIMTRVRIAVCVSPCAVHVAVAGSIHTWSDGAAFHNNPSNPAL